MAVMVVASLGLVGASVLDRFLDGGSEDADGGDAMGGDDPFGGGGGGSTSGDGFDDFDGMDEWDDGLEEDDDGTDTDELEKRIDDLEAEVASLSSTVSTVRSENEQISGTVGDVEEDVRNLLEIYEMVTRGINPFVDGSSGFGDVNGGDSSFGLFDDEGEEEPEPELDDELASADADGFFDEELVEPDDEDGFDDEDEFDDVDDELSDELDDAANDGEDMTEDGKSFSELKEEYDAGEADWADDGAETDADDPIDGDRFDGAGSIDDRHAADAGGDPGETNGGGFEYVREDELSGRRDKPYLTELPGDYVGDLLVMEWLEFLVDASDVTDAVRAINYYERIEWIGPVAAAGLRDFLSGFGTIDRNVVDRPGTDQLVREHHTRSLRYVTQLDGTSFHTVLLDRWDLLAGGSLLGGEPPEPVQGGRGRNATAGRHVRNGNGGGVHDAGGRRGRGGEERRDRGGDERRDRGGDDPRRNGEVNGASPRPRNDPNPSDRADPADGEWGDGR